MWFMRSLNSSIVLDRPLMHKKLWVVALPSCFSLYFTTLPNIMKHLIPATAQPSETIRNDASLLIPGREEPIKNASLVAYKNKIEFVGEKNALPDHFKDVMPTTVLYLFACQDCGTATSTASAQISTPWTTFPKPSPPSPAPAELAIWQQLSTQASPPCEN